MFMPLAFRSVNLPQHLLPGKYTAMCSTYIDTLGEVVVMFIEYTREGASDSTAADIIVKGRDQRVRARDVCRLADGAWRDSDGRKAEKLADLVPAELLGLTLHSRFDLPDCYVEPSNEQ